MLSEPWFRTSDGWWYAYVRDSGGRRQLRLVKGEDRRDEAWDRWTELRQSLKRTGKLPSESAVTLLDEFLEWCKQNRSAATYQIYLYHLQSFISFIGDRKLVSELKPKDVTAWLAASTWSDSTKAGGAQTVRTAFRWLAREGHIDRSPVDGARAPAKTRREVIISPETFQKILEKSRPDFRRLLEFVWRTGCRPQEVVRIEIRHVDLSLRRIVFPPSEAKGKKHPRVIYLDDRAIAIVIEAMKTRRTGHLFRNAHGKPWHHNMIRCRFRRLRDKVGGDFCTYHLRHSYATTALQSLDPITVATLMGHSDATTLARNYQHLAKLPAVMQEAARKATTNLN